MENQKVEQAIHLESCSASAQPSRGVNPELLASAGDAVDSKLNTPARLVTEAKAV
jgi:hypothetical protein